MNTLPERQHLAQDEKNSLPVVLRPMDDHLLGSSQIPTALTVNPNALTLLKALRRRLRPALAIGIPCGILAGVLAWLLIPSPEHVAKALIQTSQNQEYLLHKESGNVGNQFLTFQKTQIALIKTRDVLNDALNNLKTNDLTLFDGTDPLVWLERYLKADYSVGPEYLTISLSGDNPKELELVVNAVVAAYLKLVLGNEKTNRTVKLNQLKELMEDYKTRLKKGREDLKALAKEAGSGDPQNLAHKQKLFMDDLSGAKKDLQKILAQMRKAFAELAMEPKWSALIWNSCAGGYLVGCVPGPGLPINLSIVVLAKNQEQKLLGGSEGPIDPVQLKNMVDGMMGKDGTTKKLQDKAAELETKISAIRRVYKEAAFLRASEKERKELESVREDLANNRKKYEKEALATLRAQGMNKGNANFQKLMNHWATLKEQHHLLKKDVEELKKASNNAGEQGIGLESIREEIAAGEKTQQNIAKELEKWEVEKDAPFRIKKPKDGAYVYPPRNFFIQYAGIGGASFLAMGLVFFGFAWTEFRARKVASPDEVTQGLGIRLVGTIPGLVATGSRNLGNENVSPLGYGQSILTESVDTVRTMLLHASRSESIRVVMVTSAMPGEGKTSLASHLAASLARAGNNTLLIDGDLRNPALHRVFDVPKGPGLSEVLRGEVDVGEVIRETFSNKLSLLPAGQCDFQAIHFLAQKKLQPIFDRLRKQYDLIVLDSSPVLPVNDSLLIGQYADALLFSIMHNFSRLPKVYAAYQRLAMLGIRMLGRIVSGTHDDLYVPSYHYTDFPKE